MRTIKVFGHKSPDTDSICSAIIYAWYLNEIKQQPATPCRLGKINKETEYVLKRFGFSKPRLLTKVDNQDRVVVVDTNNPDELIDLDGAQLLEVLDHHKLSGGIETIDPVNFTLRKTASTATVIYLRFNSRNIYHYPREIAGLMLAAIISDSIKFTSPTTTDTDVYVAKKIAKKYNFDIDELAEKMFEAKSSISNLSDEEIVLLDSKVYRLNNKHYRISVVEITDSEKILSRKDGINSAIKRIKKEQDLDELFVFAVDILKKEALLINEDKHSKDIIREAYTIEIETGNGVLLPGVISRKRQIIPALAG